MCRVFADAIDLLLQNKRYFGGGTVDAISSTDNFVAFRQDPAHRLEDGTVPFLSIASLKFGFNILDSLGMENIERYGVRMRTARHTSQC
jgi:molybdenum cofactor sulfurtransferase